MLAVVGPGVRLGAQPPALTLEAPIARTIDPGGADRYDLALHADEFVRLVVDGRGMLLRVVVTDEAGRLVTARERVGGAVAPIEWTFVASETATLRVVVTSLEAAGAKRTYRIALAARRPRAEHDDRRVSAAALVAEAERLEREGAVSLPEAQSAYERAALQWRAAGDHADEARALLHLGRLRADAGLTRDAESAFDLALAGCRAAADASCEGQVRHRLGRLQAFTGRPAEAATNLLAARELREQTDDRAGQAETLMELGSLESTRSANDLALSYLDRAIDLARAAEDRRTEADALNTLGVIAYNRGDSAPARAHYEAARTLRATIGDQPGFAQTTSNLGVLVRSLGESRAAIAYYDEALAIRRALGATQSIANTLHNLGVAHADLGEHQRALELFGEALGLWRQSGGKRGEAFALQATGQSYARLGDRTRALEYYAQCLPLWKATGDTRGEAQTLLASAGIHLESRDLERASARYLHAEALGREAGLKREVGLALAGVAAVRRQSGQADVALSDARTAVDMLRDIGDRREQGRALAEVGASLVELGRLSEADTVYRESVALYQAVEARVDEALARTKLAAVAERAGRTSDAPREALAAIDLLESERAALSAEGLSLSLAAARRPIYDEVIGLLMRLHGREPTAGHDEAAFALSERLHARVLLDLLHATELTPRHGDPDLVAALRRTQELINGKAARLTRLLSASPTGGPGAAAARAEVDDLLARLDVLRSRLRAGDPEIANLVSPPAPLALAEIRASLGDAHTAIIEFVLGEQESFAWVISERSHVSVALPPRVEIERLAARALAALGPADPVAGGGSGTAPSEPARGREAVRSDPLALLAARLVAPAAAALEGRSRLIIVPDGVLHAFPFAALPSPSAKGEPLGATHELVIMPSASVGVALRARSTSRTPPSSRIAVFADPVFTRDDARVPEGAASTDRRTGGAPWPLPRLRFSRQEASGIAKLAPDRTTVWADFAASRATVLQSGLADFGILHFAAHAVVDRDRPQLSGIVLSQVDRRGRDQDGLVRLHEIYSLPLRARLVVLSACHTALGRPVDGEGLVGLARGFLHAGADAVVATLWAVDDRATSAFMQRFYDAMLTQRQTPPAALRSAVHAMRQDARWSRPADWAAFVLIGTRGLER